MSRATRLVRSLVLAAALSVAALGGVAAPAHAALSLGFIDDQYASHDPVAFYADMDALKARVMRIDLIWSLVAPKQPADASDPLDPAYDWKRYDALVRGATAHGGIRVLFTIWGTPHWARLNSAWNHPYSVPRPAALAQFAAAAATRYSGTVDPDGLTGPETTLPKVASWEIWNEPQLRTSGLFFRSRLPSVKWTLLAARYYTMMTRAAYQAIHDAGDFNGVTETVAGCSCANKHTMQFLTALRRFAGASPPWDVISIHPYNSVPGLGVGDGTTADPSFRAGNVRIGNFKLFLQRVDKLWPHRRYRIWITEYGWQTFPDHILGVAPAKQATFLKQAIGIFRKRYRRVDMLVNYLIRDEPVYPGSWQSGLRFLDGRKKPAYAAWVALVGG